MTGGRAATALRLEDDPGETVRAKEWEGLTRLGHEPVLRADVVRLLLTDASRPGQRLVDATVGLGGHAEALLEAGPGVELLGIDRDPEALERARARLAAFGGRVHLMQARFSELESCLDLLGWTRIDGVLADLGVSSLQLDAGSRGFSFQQDAPLDMRMDPTRGESAADLIARLDEIELARLLRELGEEPAARRIARAIVRSEPRPATTGELRGAVRRALGERRGR
ncbi:MAG: 16S rRNA (cytosine(1402)-N(4))-methyltransferase RsmH, partial [Deltaproteobacteria bacterium]|nr:16S rRNA (cytosine(1402)-N(4))-methyltransferase RsmH [Deltaproteobacteria bacterium]